MRWLTTHYYETTPATENHKSHAIILSNDPDEINCVDNRTTPPLAPVFDYDAVCTRLMDDSELIRTLAKSFLVDMSTQIEQFKLSVLANDIDKATAQAHKIKGSSANIGGMALSELALQLEQAGKAGDLSTMHGLLNIVDQHFDQLKTVIEEKLR